jgi:hypothetical protein
MRTAKLNRDVLAVIPTLVTTTTTTTGKDIIMQIIETRQYSNSVQYSLIPDPSWDAVTISDSTAHEVADSLTPMLKETSSFTRAIIIELLLKLYMKHRMITRHWP